MWQDLAVLLRATKFVPDLHQQNVIMNSYKNLYQYI